MKVLLLVCVAVLTLQNQVCATEERSGYSEFDIVRVLVDDPHNGDRSNAVLALDKSGKPAVYLLFEGRHPCVTLSQHSLSDILAHWTPAGVKLGVHSFSFLYWASAAWKPARVDLQFRNNYCDRFRVVSDDTKIQSWLPAEAIPEEGYGHHAVGQRDIFFGLVEGPRDTTDCGVRPLSDRYFKAVQEGNCPVGAAAQNSRPALLR